MRKVKSAAVKAAALSHARKQLRAIIGSDAVGVNCGSVDFRGQIAYAQWALSADRSSVASFHINYPDMPDNSWLTRRDADLISAYTNHEVGHVAFTLNLEVRGASHLLRMLWNGIEDARIEHAVALSGRANGARSGFKQLLSSMTAKISDRFNPTSINSAPFALALVCRAAYGDGNGYAKTLLDRIPEPKRSIYKAAADGVIKLPLDRSGTAGAMALAREFIESWSRIEPIDANDQQHNKQPEQSYEFDDRDDDQSDDQDDSQSDGEDGLDEEAENELAAAEEESEAGEVSSAGSFEPVDIDDASEGSSGDGSESSEMFAEQTENYSEELCKSPEPSIDEVFDRVRSRVERCITLPVTPKVPITRMSQWASIKQKQDDEAAVRRAFRKLSKSSLPALKAQLYQVLKSPERVGWDSGSIGGRFDVRRAPRMLAGSEAVFKRRWLSEGIETAVTVLVDMSGSMRGDRAKDASDLAWTIAQAAESAGAMVEVAGFRSPNMFEHTIRNSGYSLFGEFNSGTGYDGMQGVLVIAKQFNERCNSVPLNFAKLPSMSTGNTPDYTCLRAAVERLSTVDANRRIVIVITDGFGERNKVKLMTCVSKNLFDVEVVAFGIGTCDEDLKMAYNVGAAVRRSDDLAAVALKKIIKQLKASDHRRVA